MKADEDHRFRVENKCQVILLVELRVNPVGDFRLLDEIPRS